MKKQEKNNEYFQILISLIKEKIGEIKELRYEYNDIGKECISIMINGYAPEIIYLDGDYFLIMDWKNKYAYKFNNKEFYKDYIKQIIDNQIIPLIKKCYKNGTIKTLIDSKLFINEKFNIKINKDWFEKIFNIVALEESNGEIIEKIKIELSEKKTKLIFDVNCGKYGLYKENNIIITNRGDIRINLCELLEGGSIEYKLKEKIEKHIKKI